MEAAKTAGVAVITAGGAPVGVPAPAGLTGSARAIMIRDPDGYPVELMQLTPAPSSAAPDASDVLGAQMSVVVSDLAASLNFYRRFIGADLQTWEGDGYDLRRASDTHGRRVAQTGASRYLSGMNAIALLAFIGMTS